MDSVTKKISPRRVPDRDAKYMGLAWFYASFSKDPNTQVGAVIVDEYNYPLGSGYNGPPRLVPDDSFSWERPGSPEDFSKYDVVVHAEINAIDHSCTKDLTNATLYVTALPCPHCMLEIARKEMGRVVYFDLKRNDPGSMFHQTQKWAARSMKIAEMAQIKVEKFTGNVAWMPDWILRLKELGVFAT